MLLNNVPNYYNFIEIDDYDKKKYNVSYHLMNDGYYNIDFNFVHFYNKNLIHNFLSLTSTYGNN